MAFLSRPLGAVILRLPCKFYGNFSIVKKEMALSGALITTLHNMNEEECKTECRYNYQCKSVNINNARTECELNSKVIEDEGVQQLVEKPGWFYTSTSYEDRLVGPNCREKDPCNEGYFCKDTCDCPGYKCFKGPRLTEGQITKYPSVPDCKEWRKLGFYVNGVYEISISGFQKADVYCDMKTKDGGWTVIQRREDGSQDFFRTWNDYKDGFGELNGEFWLGNEIIHNLTMTNDYIIRFDLKDLEGNERYAEYSAFSIKDESDKYRLCIGDYSGDAGDSFKYHNNRKFSTKDQDNNDANGDCSDLHKGAWWYSTCHHSNLNALYLNGTVPESLKAQGVTWLHWKAQRYSLPWTEMKIIPISNDIKKDCREIYFSGQKRSGTYEIDPDGLGKFKVYCEMQASGNGWLMLQRRKDGTVDFYRNWNSYKNGFGDFNHEFWLGNEKMHRITKNGGYILRFDLWDKNSVHKWAEYKSLRIGSEAEKYIISFGEFSGDVADSFTRHNNRKFTTHDQDNDEYTANNHGTRNCAVLFKAAWWYDNCFSSNLNGMYVPTSASHENRGIFWSDFAEELEKTEIKIRRFVC